MTPVEYDLSPEQVIGRVLIDIRQVCTINDDAGHDWAYSFFILDSGVTFSLPGEWASGLRHEPVPAEAVPLAGIDAIRGQRIAGLLRPLPGSDILNESLYLLFDNGYLATDMMAGWHGTGSTGVYIFPPGQIDLRQLELLWPPDQRRDQT